MKIDNVRCTKCGGNDFQNYCTTCKDLEAHDDAIRRECAEACNVLLENIRIGELKQLFERTIMNAGKE